MLVVPIISSFNILDPEIVVVSETINLNLENSGLVEFGDANCGSSEVDKGMLKCPNNSCTLVFQKEKVVDFKEAKPSEQVEDMKRHQKPELRTLENEEVGFLARQLSPLELNENDYDNDAPGYSSPILSSRKPQSFACCLRSLEGAILMLPPKFPVLTGKHVSMVSTTW